MENLKQQVDSCKTIAARKELIEKYAANIKKMGKDIEANEKALKASAYIVESVSKRFEKQKAIILSIDALRKTIEQQKQELYKIIELCLIANEKEESEPIVMGPLLSCN